MACCLPFTVSVGVGWGSHSWLTRVGRIRNQHALLSTAGRQGVRGGLVPPTFCPQLSAAVQVPGPLMGSWVGQVGKGGLWPCPSAPVGLAAAMRLPEEGEVVLAQDSTSPWRLGLCHDVLEPGCDIHLKCLIVLDEAVFL